MKEGDEVVDKILNYQPILPLYHHFWIFKYFTSAFHNKLAICCNVKGPFLFDKDGMEEIELENGLR